MIEILGIAIIAILCVLVYATSFKKLEEQEVESNVIYKIKRIDRLWVCEKTENEVTFCGYGETAEKAFENVKKFNGSDAGGEINCKD